jgi:RimJ/RimL family protein N-acetyltransferase
LGCLSDNLVCAPIGFIINKYCKERTIEKATAIKPTYWRKGIGKEASITLINAAFENNLAKKIIGHRHIDNQSSQKFTYDLGFKDIRVLKEDRRTVVKYQLSKNRWKEKHGFYYLTSLLTSAKKLT